MKLSLNIEPGLIEYMKKVAKKRIPVFQKLRKGFFKKEVYAEKEPFTMKAEGEIFDWVKGLVAVNSPVKDFDHKKEYHKHLKKNTGSENNFLHSDVMLESSVAFINTNYFLRKFAPLTRIQTLKRLRKGISIIDVKESMLKVLTPEQFKNNSINNARPD